MRLALVLIAALALVGVATFAIGHETAEGKKVQKLCPVDDQKVKKQFYADHNGKRIYFCCEECAAAFKKAPEKYVEKLDKDGVVTENVPKEK